MLLAVALAGPARDCEAGDVGACRRVFEQAWDRAVVNAGGQDARWPVGLFASASEAARLGCVAGDVELCEPSEGLEGFEEVRPSCGSPWPPEPPEPMVVPFPLPGGAWTWYDDRRRLGGTDVRLPDRVAGLTEREIVFHEGWFARRVVGPTGVRVVQGAWGGSGSNAHHPFVTSPTPIQAGACAAEPKAVRSVHTGTGPTGCRAAVTRLRFYELVRNGPVVGGPPHAAPRVPTRFGERARQMASSDDVVDAIALVDRSMLVAREDGTIERRKKGEVVDRWVLEAGIVDLLPHPDGSSVAVVWGAPDRPTRVRAVGQGGPESMALPRAWADAFEDAERETSPPTGPGRRGADWMDTMTWDGDRHVKDLYSRDLTLPGPVEAFSCTPATLRRIAGQTLAVEGRSARRHGHWAFVGGDPATPWTTATSARWQDGPEADWRELSPTRVQLVDPEGQPLSWVGVSIAGWTLHTDADGWVPSWGDLPVELVCPGCALGHRREGDRIVVDLSLAARVPSSALGLWKKPGARRLRRWATAHDDRYVHDGELLTREDGPLRRAEPLAFRNDDDVFTGRIEPLLTALDQHPTDVDDLLERGLGLGGMQLARDDGMAMDLRMAGQERRVSWTYHGRERCGDAWCARIEQRWIAGAGADQTYRSGLWILDPETLDVHEIRRVPRRWR
jgi:hypothetical protein